MGYVGKIYQVPCSKGGFNFNENTDLIDPSMIVAPSRNVNLNRNGRKKRGGTSKVNSTAVGGSPRIMGIYDFRLDISTSYQVFAGNDGNIYKNSTTILKTGMSTVNKFNFETFGNELYIADGAHRPQTWDGSSGSTSDITTPAADWSGTDQPFQFISHGRGLSRRLWALMGNVVYYSSLGNGKEFSGGTSGKITIDLRNGEGLTGGIEFGNRLMIFSKDRSFIIDDEDPSTSNWGYAAAQWDGGASSWRLIVRTPNDIALFTDAGDIYSISAVQSYGDYAQASIARPAFIDNYIRDNIDLSLVDDFHATYDPSLRAIKFFCVRQGLTEVDTALLYFIDRPSDEAWSVHDNQDTVSGYSASCSTLVRVSLGNFNIYTGDYDGFIWKLEQTSLNDDSASYYAGFKTPNLTFENPRLKKQYKRCYLITKTEGDFLMQVNVWVDGQVQQGGTISLSGSGGVLDVDVLDDFVLGGIEFVDRPMELGMVGKRIQFEFFNSNADQDFFVSQILIDFKPLSVMQ